jgi:hypothetical protein
MSTASSHCRACYQLVSINAQACPHCGEPGPAMTEIEESQHKERAAKKFSDIKTKRNNMLIKGISIIIFLWLLFTFLIEINH